MAAAPGGMTLSARTLWTLAGLVVLVVALGVYRASSRSGAPTHAAIEAPAEPGHGLPGLLDFGRGTCIPCQKMMPVLDELATRHEGRIVVRYLDLKVAANHERASALGVTTIPTQILVSADGTEVERHVGFWSLDAIEARLVELGWTSAR